MKHKHNWIRLGLLHTGDVEYGCCYCDEFKQVRRSFADSIENSQKEINAKLLEILQKNRMRALWSFLR